MDTLLLTVPDTDPGGWDLAVVDGDIAVASDGYQLAQDAASAIKTFKGEVYYDTAYGVPYNVAVLGKVPPTQLLKNFLVNAALSVPGVSSAACYFTGFVDRKLSGQVQVTDASGNTTAAAF